MKKPSDRIMWWIEHGPNVYTAIVVTVLLIVIVVELAVVLGVMGS